MGVGIASIQLDGAAEGIHGGGRVVQLEIHHTELAQRWHVARVLLDHHLKQLARRQETPGGEGFLRRALIDGDVAVQLAGVAADRRPVLREG